MNIDTRLMLVPHTSRDLLMMQESTCIYRRAFTLNTYTVKISLLIISLRNDTDLGTCLCLC